MGIKALSFYTHNFKKDRDLVLPLMQLGFEQTDSIKRRSSLLEILKIYGEAPDYYGNNERVGQLLESFRRKNIAEEEKLAKRPSTCSTQTEYWLC